MRSVDVVVVGAGPAGVSAAFEAQRRGLNVCVITRAARRTREIQSLPPEAVAELARFDFEPAGILCPGVDAVWGNRTGPTFAPHLTNPYGFGVHVDRTVFDAALASHAHERGIDFVFTTGRLTICGTEDHFVVAGGECPTLNARWIIDASGRSACVARQRGVHRLVFDRLVAVSTFFDAACSAQSLTVESCEFGWWYAAPGQNGATFVALVSDGDLVNANDLCRTEAFTRLLARSQTIAARVNGKPHEALLARSCESALLAPCAGDGWFAVGDAAMTFDPLSAAGIAAAVRMGREAVAAACSASSATYAARQARAFGHYMSMREAQYSIERRWCTPFWRRRQTRRTLLESTNEHAR